MKKKLFLLTAISAVSAATLMGCGTTKVSVNTDTVSVTDSVPESSTVTETPSTESSVPESSTVVEGSSASETSAATETSAASEVDTNNYIGMTVNDFVAEGNEHSDYSGFNGIYEFNFKNTTTMTAYKITLSDDVTDIMEKKEFGQDYEDLIGECTIVDIQAKVADNAKLQEYVGKTLNDLEADGIEHAGHIIMDDLVVLIAYDEILELRMEYGEDAGAVVNALNDPDREEVANALREYPIKSIYYMLY